MTWLIVGRLRVEALRDAIGPLYFFTPTPNDYCSRTQLSLTFFVSRLMKGVAWPCINVREKFSYEKRKDARLGRGLVFDDEIAAWQRMRPDAHPTQFRKQERFRGSQQFGGSKGLSQAG